MSFTIKSIFVLCVVVGTRALPNYNTGTTAPSGDYGGTSGGGYGSTTKCTPYDETVHTEKCEAYTDKVCYTTHQESCSDVTDQQCRAIVTGKQERKCFNVVELQCSLREQVEFDTINAVFTVQRCHKVSERVCDTVYDLDFKTKDDFQCLNVPNPVCNNEERTVYEKTCRTTTSFDCNFADVASYGSSSKGSSGSDGYDSAGHTSDYGGSDSYGSTTPASCTRKQDTKCYTTPRQVSTQTCTTRQEKVCEKLSGREPFTQERQVCHNEEKKVCELEQKTQPKQIKKYVYTKHCRNVPKVLCENMDEKSLVQSCVPTSRKTCRSTPSERCEDVPKQHCYKVPSIVRRERCETVPAYSAPQAQYSAPPAAVGYESPSSASSYD